MKLGFLGYGNLARALARGICSQNILGAADIYICANTEATLSYARALGHNTAKTAAELFELCDIVVLAIKPKVFRTMQYDLSRIDTTGKRVVSVMAAVKLDEIESTVRCPVMRVMPTLAAADAKDIMGYSYREGFDDVAPVLARLGDAMRLDEPMLERLTVAASCGLGFAAHVLEAYKNQCVNYGFEPEQAEAITRRMFGYAANNVSVTDGVDGFADLERRVATKGGVTEAGNNAMNDKLCEAFESAFDTAGDLAGVKKQ